MNCISISGRLTKNPDRYMTKSGKLVAKFSIAVNGRTGKDGLASTMWLDVTCFTYVAEYVLKYFHKGDLVGIEGSLEHESYTKSNGEKKQAYFVYAKNVEALRKREGDKKEDGPSDDLPYAEATPNEQAKQAFEASDDDLPF